MQRNSVHATLIILLSIVTIIAQFSTYYFFGSTLITFAFSALISLLCTHIFLEKSLSYEPCFSYSLLNVFICFIIILLSYFGSDTSILPYQHYLLLFILLNWLVPTLYCMIRCLFDRGPKYSHFNSFYRNISIVFLIIYVGVLINLFFLQNGSKILYFNDFRSINFVPFLTLATLIEDYLGGYVSLSNIVAYLSQSILLFVPYGFYSVLLLKYHSRLTRFITFLLFPLFIEVIQRVFLLGKCDIDDIIFALFGCILGGLCYHLLNRIFLSATDEDFLYERSPYSFYRNSFHF